jgi:16S rRNA (cytidine1402-2'-O)-methyltransferase
VSGTLYVVATPIGNLEDMTFRAVRVLGEVELVAAEDTRRTRRLLTHFAISKPLVSYHEHNEREQAGKLLKRLEAGDSIALVSDAGTPGISDPGHHLVVAAIAKGISVVPVPGASAIVAAASAAGLPVAEFHFGGFLPSRARARRARLEQLAVCAATLVFYEAPHRITAALADALAVLGDRRAVLARELTKLHEEFVRGTLSELVTHVRSAQARGEFVLLVEGVPSPQVAADAPLEERVGALVESGMAKMDAIKQVARERGLPKRVVYAALAGDSGQEGG